MKDSLTEHNTWGLERVHPEFILNIADALHSVADKSKELGGYINDIGETSANGANGANGEEEDGLKVPELQVIPPDTSLMPERNDTEHRKLMSRKTQQQNIASLNVILSSSKTHETTSFVLDGVKDALNNDKENESDIVIDNNNPPRTPVRSPTRTTKRDVYESIASPQLLRKLKGRDQTSEVCVVQ